MAQPDPHDEVQRLIAESDRINARADRFTRWGLWYGWFVTGVVALICLAGCVCSGWLFFALQ